MPSSQHDAHDEHDAHDAHDLELIASLADRDLDPAARARAEALISECSSCAALAAEIRALATGLAELPLAIPAPRDLRLSPAVAARARRGSGWRAILRPFGGAAWSPLRPVGAALAALGLAGILVTNAPIGTQTATAPAVGGGQGPFGAAASAPGAANHGPSEGTTDVKLASPPAPAQQNPPNAGGSPAPSLVPELGVSSAAPSPAASLGRTTGAAAASAAVGGAGTSTDQSTGTAAPATTAGTGAGSTFRTLPPLTVLSIALLIVGLAMLGVRVAARRLA
jgi:hypothetical protein